MPTSVAPSRSTVSWASPLAIASAMALAGRRPPGRSAWRTRATGSGRRAAASRRRQRIAPTGRAATRAPTIWSNGSDSRMRACRAATRCSATSGLPPDALATAATKPPLGRSPRSCSRSAMSWWRSSGGSATRSTPGSVSSMVARARIGCRTCSSSGRYETTRQSGRGRPTRSIVSTSRRVPASAQWRSSRTRRTTPSPASRSSRPRTASAVRPARWSGETWNGSSSGSVGPPRRSPSSGSSRRSSCRWGPVTASRRAGSSPHSAPVRASRTAAYGVPWSGA